MTEHTRDREWLIAAFREVAGMDQRTDERKRGQNYEDAADAVLERLRVDGEREPVGWVVIRHAEVGMPAFSEVAEGRLYNNETAASRSAEYMAERGEGSYTIHPVGERHGEREPTRALDEDEHREAHRIYTNLKRVTDPYALDRTIEHFLRERLRGGIEGWVVAKHDPSETVTFYGHEDYTTQIKALVRPATLLLHPVAQDEEEAE